MLPMKNFVIHWVAILHITRLVKIQTSVSRIYARNMILKLFALFKASGAIKPRKVFKSGAKRRF